MSRREVSRRRLLALPIAGFAAGCASKVPAITGKLSSPAATPAASPTIAPAAAAATPATVLEPVVAHLAHPKSRFGLNYTPSRVWWDLWQKFDPHRVNDDLAAIASLGVDHIRVQLLWSVFQPTAKGADPAMLSKLTTMLDIADHHNLDVCTSVITASLSGQHFVPAWANGQDWIAQPELVAAQEKYISDLGGAIGSHKRLLGFDLGNENLGQAPDRSAVHLRNWATRLVHASYVSAPRKVHTVSPNGLFSVPYPEIVATVGDLSVIHPWCFIGGSVLAGELRHGATHHAEYNVEHIRSYHPFDPGPRRRVWVQEVGAPRINFYGQPVIPAAYSADFVETTVRSLLTCEDIWGITWWCSHDIDPVLHRGRFHPPEYTLGLFDTKGHLKPGGRRFAAMIDDYHAGRLEGPVPRPTAVVGSRSLVFDNLEIAGTPATIVQPGRVDDDAYLARRGITTLVH